MALPIFLFKVSVRAADWSGGETKVPALPQGPGSLITADEQAGLGGGGGGD